MIPAKQTWPEDNEASTPIAMDTTESPEVIDPRLYSVVKVLIIALLYYVIVLM